MATLPVFITVDVDPDNFDASVFGARDGMRWRGLEEGIPSLLETGRLFLGEDGQPPVYTWLVRCDGEIREAHGQADYLLQEYRNLWSERERQGDEVGWHPHEKTPDGLRQAYSAWREDGREPVSVRIGELFQSTEMMCLLDQWGFKVDSTAFPGRRRNDTERCFDWEATPRRIYHPSVEDYRRPGKTPLKILEVPMTMIMTQVEYDPTPVLRYLNPGFHEPVIRNGLEHSVRHCPFLVMNLHPSELIPRKDRHPLLSFSREVVRENWRRLHQYAEECGRRVQYKTLRDIPKLIQQGVLNVEGAEEDYTART